MAPRQTTGGDPEPTPHHRYHPLLRSRQSFTSEQNLMLALLTDAVELSLRSDAADHHVAAQAWDWILGFGPSGISFEDACDAVGLDHGALRKYLRRLRTGAMARTRRH